MGKKLFRFFTEAAKRVEKPDVDLMRKESAVLSEDRMRDLIRREYSPEQLVVLEDLSKGAETAARYSDRTVAIQDVVAPTDDMLRVISEQTGLEVVDLREYAKPDYKLRSMITAEQAKAMRVIPIKETDDGAVVVAIADPSNPMIADDLRLILGREVKTVIASEDEIDERIEQYYGMGDETLEDIVDQQGDTTDENVISQRATEVDLSDLEALANAAPIIKLVNILLARAINDRASDIHIEPFPAFIRIRYRVDGVLREIPAPPRSQLLPIVSRVKVLAGMNISESRLPQDGRIKTTIESREVDIRVSTVPTVHGESIVMRVLDKSMMMIGISHIGMLPDVVERFKKIIRRPNGIILVTGPTGCGKTTTLYASLAEVRDPGEKFITTEDPVEYEMAGIQQVNINENVGLTFARCLRAILRQDPDKVLVGEIRDVETAQIAVQASLTGHLVFSTLHTNSAAATVTRLLDMGVEPFLITSSLEAIVGQRLIRTICPACKRPYVPSEEELIDFGVSPADVAQEGITFFQGEGCSECNHTGYHGRIGIFELLELTDEVRDLILERATTDEIHELALRQGMITMRQDGWHKACIGVTTLSEVARQTPKEAEREEGVVTGELELAEAQAELEQKAAREALPKPAPQLDQRQMMIEGEAAMPAAQAGDGERTKE